MRKIFLLAICCMLVLTACGRKDIEVNGTSAEYERTTEAVTSEVATEVAVEESTEDNTENNTEEKTTEEMTSSKAVTESSLEIQTDIPECMEGIADKVLYGDDLAKWNNWQLESAMNLYTEFTICTIVKDNKYYRALYSDNGVVIVDNDNDKDFTIYYNRESLTVPMEYTLGSELHVLVNFLDIDGEGDKELAIVQSKDDYKLHIIRLEPLELISHDFDMNTVVDELIAGYGLSDVTVENNRAVADFYFNFANGAKLTGDVDFGVPEGAEVGLDNFNFYFYNMYAIIGDYPSWAEDSSIKLLLHAKVEHKDAISTYADSSIFLFYIMLEYDKESGRYVLTDDITVRWQDADNENYEISVADAVMVTDFLENKELYEQEIALEYGEAAKKYPDKDFFDAGIYIDEEKCDAGYIYTYDKYSVTDNGKGTLTISNGNIKRTVEVEVSTELDDMSERLFYVHMYIKEDGTQIIVLEKESYVKLHLERDGAVLASEVKEDGFLCFYADTLAEVELSNNYRLDSDETTRCYLFDSIKDGIDRNAWYEYDFDGEYWTRIYEYNDIQLVETYERDLRLRYNGKYVELPWYLMNFGPGCGMDFYMGDVNGDGNEDVILNYHTREENVHFIYDLINERDISPVYNEYKQMESAYGNYCLENIVLYDEYVEVIRNAVNNAYEETGLGSVNISFEEFKSELEYYTYLEIKWDDEGKLIFYLKNYYAEYDSDWCAEGVFTYNGEGYELVINNVKIFTDGFTGIAGDILFGDELKSWSDFQLKNTLELYSDFAICTVIRDGKYYRALYSDNGVVVVDNDDNETYTVYYNGEELTVPMDCDMGNEWRVKVNLMDVDDDDEKELFIVESTDDYKIHIIKLEPFELIPHDFDLSVIDELFIDYGISEITVDGDEATVRVYFEKADGEVINNVASIKLKDTAAVDVEDFSLEFYDVYTILGNPVKWPDPSIRLIAYARVYQKGAVTAEKYVEIYTFYIPLEYNKESREYVITGEITTH